MSQDQAFWRNREDIRTETIIVMVKRQATLGEMANAVGYSKELVRRVINLMKDEYGEQVFASKKEIWTPQEVADKLGVRVNSIYKLCKNGTIPNRKRGVKGEGGYLIYEEGMRLLRTHPMVTGKITCCVCRKKFSCDWKTRRPKICPNKECKDKHYRQQREGRVNRQPSLSFLKGWRKDLWEALQNHQVPGPEHDKWLTVTKAALETGLSRMQLRWLQRCHIVMTSPDPVKKCKGKPVMMYSASQMQVAKKVFRAHQRKRSCGT